MNIPPDPFSAATFEKEETPTAPLVMEKAPATMSFSLDIICPKCGNEIDLTDCDNDGVYTTPIFNNKWDDLKGELVECECGAEFQISEVEY